MKHNNCPNCNSDQPLRDCWYGIQLRQECRNCGWTADPRQPEQLPIRDKQTVSVSRFGGYEYTAYDKFGHVIVYSCTYSTREKVEVAIEQELERGKRDEGRGPYTIVLWPATVEVTGQIFKSGEAKS